MTQTAALSFIQRHGHLWRIPVWGAAAALLAAPLIGARFIDGLHWTGSDFALFAVMLAIPLAILELAARVSGDWTYRLAVAVAVGTAFLIAWANLAVGIIGNEDNPLNGLFFAVFLVPVAGTLIARFKPRGMARALQATAAAQVVVAVVAQLAGHFTWVATTAFCLAWLLSAWLFGKAARQDRV